MRDGKPIRENLDSEGITDDELKAQLRKNGVDDAARVKAATLESDGEISVIPKEDEQKTNPPREPAPPTASDRPPDFERAVGQFLTAAAELRAAVAWHEERAADHKAAAKAARELLARHGVRPGKATTSPDPSSPAAEAPR